MLLHTLAWLWLIAVTLIGLGTIASDEHVAEAALVIGVTWWAHWRTFKTVK
jgi:hypothetical protein